MTFGTGCRRIGIKIAKKKVSLKRNMTTFVLPVTKGNKYLPIHRRSISGFINQQCEKALTIGETG
jgi:hypothetical protein